jgi:hypothetical protein
MTAVTEWIRIEDRLPQEGIPVLVTWAHTGNCDIAVFREAQWIDSDGIDEGTEFDEPTHWMPLPEGPHTGDSEETA